MVSTAKLKIILQPALMMAQKPENVGLPPGVGMMIQMEDKEVNGYVKNVDNIFSHPGASRTGQFKDWEAVPAPTITATRKWIIQTRILPHSDCKKRDERREPRRGPRSWEGIP